jgi:hypothetical protein
MTDVIDPIAFLDDEFTRLSASLRDRTLTHEGADVMADRVVALVGLANRILAGMSVEDVAARFGSAPGTSPFETVLQKLQEWVAQVRQAADALVKASHATGFSISVGNGIVPTLTIHWH